MLARAINEINESNYYTTENINEARLLNMLEGKSIIAGDGKFIGKITKNKYDSQSIINEYGTYGSKYSSLSIMNEYSQYGSKYSTYSVFNNYSINPPKIMNGKYFVSYLTVNKSMTQRIDPYYLIYLLQNFCNF
jgi:hypothetical protein